MDALKVEELLNKAYAIYVIEKDPAIFFLFDDFYDVTDVNLSLNNLFGEENVSLKIEYNASFANIYLSTNDEFVRVLKKPFHNSKHFELIKPMANMFNGTDVLGNKLSNELFVAAGQLTLNGGVSGGKFFADNQRLWVINKFTTQLIKEE